MIQAQGIEPDIVVNEKLPPDLAADQTNLQPRGEASLKGHLQIEGGGGKEQSGSLAYVPPNPDDDNQLHYALDLLNGLQVNSEFPPDPSLQNPELGRSQTVTGGARDPAPPVSPTPADLYGG